jgi:hypothetical protein
MPKKAKGGEGGSISLQYRHIDELRIPPYNPQIHDRENINDIKRSISEFGYVDPIIIRGSDNLVIAGAGRILALRELWAEGWRGIPETAVPVIVIECDDRTAKKLMLALNRIQSVPDISLLSQLLKSLIDEGETIETLTATGYRDFELADFLTAHADATNRLLHTEGGLSPSPLAEVKEVKAEDATLTVTRSFRIPAELAYIVDEGLAKISSLLKEVSGKRQRAYLPLVCAFHLVSQAPEGDIKQSIEEVLKLTTTVEGGTADDGEGETQNTLDDTEIR